MIKSVHNYPISQLFDIETSLVYRVPRYQREYTWTKHDWESLFDDLLENDEGYFLGSIICINQTGDALSVQELEVVDGQQRMMTLSLLFAAIYRHLHSQRKSLDDDQQVELVNLKRKLVLKKGGEIRVVPQVQNQNQQDYRAVLAEAGVVSSCEVPYYAGVRKVFRAYRYFQQRIETLANGTGVTPVMDYLQKINTASLVKIEVANHSDAYTLFESLNNRGVPLTAIDLMKNKLLAQLDKKEPGQIDHHFENWNRVLRYLGDDYTVQERFFRQHYNAFRAKLKGIHNVPIATRSNLIAIYEKLIDHDPKAFLEDTLQSAKWYSLILREPKHGGLPSLRKPLTDLERVQGTPSYLLLLFLLAEREKLVLDENHLRRVIEFLVRFFVRRNLTDLPPTRDLTRLFMQAIEQFEGRKGEDVVRKIQADLVAVASDDAEFRKRLEGPVYAENSFVVRFILCALEEQAMTREHRVDLWEKDGKQFIWTIEHVLPQSDPLPKSWVDMIADGDRDLATKLQEQNVHRLGNLTISGFNSTLGNKSFDEKRDRKDRKGRFVGYRNGLHLNMDLAESTAWEVECIDRRGDRLVQETLRLFSLGEPST